MSLRCSAWARRLAEPLAGTTPEALGWLVVELPGPWGRDAATDHRHGPAVDDVLDLPAGVRFQAIRRPDRLEPDGLRVFLAHAGRRPWLATGQIDSLADLTHVPVAATLQPDAPDWGSPAGSSLYMVCTHARRDQCCALLGRPIFDTLVAQRGEAVWETSHTGGHRFAANLLVLPHGLLFGGLSPFDVGIVADHLDDGELSIAHLRGRSRWPQVAQAAEVALRRTLDLTMDDAMELVDVDGMTVTFAVGDQMARRVTMRQDRLEPHPVSCGEEATPSTAWRLIGVSP